nr:hypothetical protein [Bacteroidota bacterium]
MIFKVYDVFGKEIKTLIDGFEKPGKHSVVFDGTINSGQAAPTRIYCGRLQIGSEIKSQKILKH